MPKLRNRILIFSEVNFSIENIFALKIVYFILFITINNCIESKCLKNCVSHSVTQIKLLAKIGFDVQFTGNFESINFPKNFSSKEKELRIK